ncbi:MAG: glycosyltransferase family 4 protein [Actinomycetota bacterium]
MTIPLLFVQGSSERAGAERMLYNLLKYLDRSLFAPTVVFNVEGPFVDEVKGLNIPILRSTPASRVRDFRSWKRSIDEIADAAKTSGARLILANGERMSIFAGRAAKAVNVASVSWLHDAPGARGLSGRAVQWLLSRTPQTTFVTCSEWLAEDFNAKLKLGAVCITNGLDLAAMPDHSDAVRTIKSQQGWGSDSVVIGHFGRLERWKGTDVFIRAAGRLLATSPDLRFLVVGDTLYGRDTDFFEELRSQANGLGLEGKLVFTGYRADALEVMSGVDVVAHCSLAPDPFPTVVLEGMALGRLVVATTTRGPEEALVHGETGMLVPPGDDAALADVIATSVGRQGFIEQVGDRARLVAHSRFAATRMAAEFQKVFQALLVKQPLSSDGNTDEKASR